MKKQKTQTKAPFIMVTADKDGVSKCDNKPMTLDGVLEEIKKLGTPDVYLMEDEPNEDIRLTFLINKQWLVIYANSKNALNLLGILEFVYDMSQDDDSDDNEMNYIN